MQANDSTPAILTLDYENEDKTEGFGAQELFERVQAHREALRPTDRNEKLERAIYAPGTQEGEARHMMRLVCGHDQQKATQNVDMQLLPHAWKQLCSRIRPKRADGQGRVQRFAEVMDALPSDHRFKSVNWALQEAAKGAKLTDRLQLWRSFEPEGHMPMLRGILSHAYTELDDSYVLEQLCSVPDMEGAIVRSMHVTPDVTTVKLVWPQRTVQLAKAGDVLAYGVIFSNSEVGRRTCSLHSATEILSCTNGMTRTDTSVRLVHTGDRDAKVRLLQEGVREVIQRGDRLVDDIRGALEERPERPLDVLDDLCKSVGATDDFGSRARELFQPTTGGSLFDVVQSMTAAAQDLYTGDERFQMERATGDVLQKALRN